jgi:hypothetical protein
LVGKLNVKAWVVTGAILWGIYLFLLTLFSVGNINFIWFNSRAFENLVAFYPGLTLSIGGAFLGLVYGAICGAICAGLFSGVHNLVLKKMV